MGCDRGLTPVNAGMKQHRTQPRTNGTLYMGLQQHHTAPNGPRILPPKAGWIERLSRWLHTWVDYYDPETGRPERPARRLQRTKRVAHWWLALPSRALSLAVALTGGRLSKADYTARLSACSTCTHMVKRIIIRRGAPRLQWYCGACGCGEWWLSELRRSAWWKRRYCSKRIQPGPYPEDAWITLTEKRDDKANKMDGVSVRDGPDSDGGKRSTVASDMEQANGRSR